MVRQSESWDDRGSDTEEDWKLHCWVALICSRGYFRPDPDRRVTHQGRTYIPRPNPNHTVKGQGRTSCPSCPTPSRARPPTPRDAAQNPVRINERLEPAQRVVKIVVRDVRLARELVVRLARLQRVERRAARQCRESALARGRTEREVRGVGRHGEYQYGHDILTGTDERAEVVRGDAHALGRRASSYGGRLRTAGTPHARASTTLSVACPRGHDAAEEARRKSKGRAEEETRGPGAAGATTLRKHIAAHLKTLITREQGVRPLGSEVAHPPASILSSRAEIDTSARSGKRLRFKRPPPSVPFHPSHPAWTAIPRRPRIRARAARPGQVKSAHATCPRPSTPPRPGTAFPTRRNARECAGRYARAAFIVDTPSSQAINPPWQTHPDFGVRNPCARRKERNQVLTGLTLEMLWNINEAHSPSAPRGGFKYLGPGCSTLQSPGDGVNMAITNPETYVWGAEPRWELGVDAGTPSRNKSLLHLFELGCDLWRLNYRLEFNLRWEFKSPRGGRIRSGTVVSMGGASRAAGKQLPLSAVTSTTRLEGSVNSVRRTKISSARKV
ncbi:hypothetical protein FB451DRAFT_1193471 [Mycena latifolia]|nr:hypothetical protein FB451DRAFT_1193471 [Mycena latifolia]